MLESSVFVVADAAALAGEAVVVAAAVGAVVVAAVHAVRIEQPQRQDYPEWIAV